MESLFEQIGRSDAVNAAVDISYKHLPANARVSPYSREVDIDK